MKSFLSLVLLLLAFQARAQQPISGTVKDNAGAPVPFATVYLEQVFEGSATDAEGNFLFETTATGPQILVASAIGFETARQQISIGSAPVKIQIVLETATATMDAVTVSAGSFGSSDKSKATILKPLDIVMNASAQGDIYKAIETLPGVSKVGEQTGLFVRGGDAHETQTYIDGTLVQNPFFSETPNMASRSRFDPFMFKGTIFTTGGYSSEYGGALSSVLLLETEDIPAESTSSLGLNMAGMNLSHVQVWNNKTALMGDVGYNNLELLFKAYKQNVDWVKEPEGFSSKLAIRHKTKKGMFKSFMQHQQGKIGLRTPNMEPALNPHEFANANSSTYWNTNYKGALSDKMRVYAGLGLNLLSEQITFDKQNFRKASQMLHAKTGLEYDLSKKIGLKIGAEHFTTRDERSAAAMKQNLQDQYTALYTESDVALSRRWAFRLGLRAERSSFLEKANLAPRTSLAFKTGKHSQVSLAWGHFYQKPEDEFLFSNRRLDFERSTHLIANYQWIAEGRSFRAELYDKQYNSLTKVEAAGLLNNVGEGYSRGLDLFWKDEISIRNLDYWISYSYIDAEREYKNYPTAATPAFVTDHTLNVLVNYNVESLGLRPGMTYTFASGRRYVNPNNDNYLSDLTKPYHNLSFNLSYVTQVFKQFAVFYGALNNPFGFEQVFGYEYSADGTNRAAVVPPAKRMFFLGLFVNF